MPRSRPTDFSLNFFLTLLHNHIYSKTGKHCWKILDNILYNAFEGETADQFLINSQARVKNFMKYRLKAVAKLLRSLIPCDISIPKKGILIIERSDINTPMKYIEWLLDDENDPLGKYFPEHLDLMPPNSFRIEIAYDGSYCTYKETNRPSESKQQHFSNKDLPQKADSPAKTSPPIQGSAPRPVKPRSER